MTVWNAIICAGVGIVIAMTIAAIHSTAAGTVTATAHMVGKIAVAFRLDRSGSARDVTQGSQQTWQRDLI